MKTSQSVTIHEFESLEHYILSVDYSRSSTVTKLSWHSISKHSHKIMQRVLPGAVWTDMTNWKSAGKSAVLTHQYSALASGVFLVLRQAWATSIKRVKKRLCPGGTRRFAFECGHLYGPTFTALIYSPDYSRFYTGL